MNLLGARWAEWVAPSHVAGLKGKQGKQRLMIPKILVIKPETLDATVEIPFPKRVPNVDDVQIAKSFLTWRALTNRMQLKQALPPFLVLEKKIARHILN